MCNLMKNMHSIISGNYNITTFQHSNMIQTDTNKYNEVNYWKKYNSLIGLHYINVCTCKSPSIYMDFNRCIGIESCWLIAAGNCLHLSEPQFHWLSNETNNFSFVIKDQMM